MKKMTCLSTLVACVLAVSAGSVFAGESTVSGGYAQGDAQGVVNKMSGFNLKYRYEPTNSAIGAIGSFTYLQKTGFNSGYYTKEQYTGITAGPAYRFNDWASLYGVVGVGYGKWQYNTQVGDNTATGDYGFSYGGGLQFNPLQNVALDLSYEQSRIRSVDVGAWIAGIGYRF